MSSVNPEFPIKLAFDIIDVGDRVYAFGLVFALLIRFLVKECDSESDVREVQLRRVVEALGGQYQLQNQCSFVLIDQCLKTM
jgi:hypothetical protein